MGEIHELFVLALSLAWFAGATPEGGGFFKWKSYPVNFPQENSLKICRQNLTAFFTLKFAISKEMCHPALTLGTISHNKQCTGDGLKQNRAISNRRTPIKDRASGLRLSWVFLEES